MRDGTLRTPIRNVVLIGSMGCGKSSVGREIARRSGLSFVDTDQLIRQKFEKSVPEIFALFGEQVFRDEEHSALSSLQTSQHIVLATGGGIVVRTDNHALLKRLGIIVWLVADEEIVWERVSRNRLRPLLQTEDPRRKMQELIEVRRPLYSALADLTIDSSRASHAQVARKVLDLVKAWRAPLDENRIAKTDP
jgi:shikimate kinase